MFTECSLPARHCAHCSTGTPHSNSSGWALLLLFDRETDTQGDFDNVQPTTKSSRAEI